MPDNPNPDFALAGHRLLALEGPDAVRFAHAQFMSDVAGLADGQWQWSGWLTPKGRVLALFALLRLDAQRVWLLLPDVDPGALAEQLRRFVFRSEVAIVTRPDLACIGTFAVHAQARSAALAVADDGTIALDVGTRAEPRTLRIIAGAVAQAAFAPQPGIGDTDDAASQARWRAYDLVHGWPRLDAGQAERWTPQQLSLQRLRAYSVKKGCYPGQEIVARTHFLGQARRGLELFVSPGPVRAGESVEVAGDVVGTIVSTACAEDSPALAVLAQERPPGELSSSGSVLVPRDLRDGLAR